MEAAMRGQQARAPSKRGFQEERYHDNVYSAMLGDILQPGDRWLDLGAGRQFHGGWLGPSCADLADRAAVVVGADLVAGHLRRNSHIDQAVVARGEGLPFKSGAFEVVSANMVVEHLPEPWSVFREVSRVLVDGGHFVLSTPNRYHPLVLVASTLMSRPLRRRLATRIEERGVEDIFPTYYRCNSVRRIRQLGNTSGLNLVSVVLFNSKPFFGARNVMGLLESWLTAVTNRRGCEVVRSNIVAVLCKRP